MVSDFRSTRRTQGGQGRPPRSKMHILPGPAKYSLEAGKLVQLPSQWSRKENDHFKATDPTELAHERNYVRKARAMISDPPAPYDPTGEGHESNRSNAGSDYAPSHLSSTPRSSRRESPREASVSGKVLTPRRRQASQSSGLSLAESHASSVGTNSSSVRGPAAPSPLTQVKQKREIMKVSEKKMQIEERLRLFQSAIEAFGTECSETELRECLQVFNIAVTPSILSDMIDTSEQDNGKITISQICRHLRVWLRSGLLPPEVIRSGPSVTQRKWQTPPDIPKPSTLGEISEDRRGNNSDQVAHLIFNGDDLPASMTDRPRKAKTSSKRQEKEETAKSEYSGRTTAVEDINKTTRNIRIALQRADVNQYGVLDLLTFTKALKAAKANIGEDTLRTVLARPEVCRKGKVDYDEFVIAWRMEEISRLTVGDQHVAKRYYQPLN